MRRDRTLERRTLVHFRVEGMSVFGGRSGGADREGNDGVGRPARHGAVTLVRGERDSLSARTLPNEDDLVVWKAQAERRLRVLEGGVFTLSTMCALGAAALMWRRAGGAGRVAHFPTVATERLVLLRPGASSSRWGPLSSGSRVVGGELAWRSGRPQLRLARGSVVLMGEEGHAAVQMDAAFAAGFSDAGAGDQQSRGDDGGESSAEGQAGGSGSGHYLSMLLRDYSGTAGIAVFDPLGRPGLVLSGGSVDGDGGRATAFDVKGPRELDVDTVRSRAWTETSQRASGNVPSDQDSGETTAPGEGWRTAGGRHK